MKEIFYSLCISIALLSSIHAQERFKYESKLNELAAPYLENRVFQSAIVGVVLDGKTWFFSYGQMSAEDKSKPNQDTLFEIGSVSKVFTGTLLADAVVNGKALQLDQTLATAHPQLSKLNPEIASKITLRHLAQHMSGLPRLPNNLMPKDASNPYADYDQKLLYEYFATAKPAQEPGRKHEYSNLGVGLLGDILAANSDTTYEALVTDRILKPLGMNSTVITLTEDTRKKMAPPTNSALVAVRVWDLDALAGAGAIRSTAGDMLKFLQANIDPPKNEVGAAIELATTVSLQAGEGHFAMGLCWMVAGDGSTRWHSGQTGGYHAMVLFNRPLNAGLVLLSNTATTEVDQLAESMFQAILGKNVEPRTFQKELVVENAIFERLVGKYMLAPGIEFTVESKENRLLVQLTGQQFLRVYPESDTVWNYRDVEAQLRFELPESGPATKLTLYQNGQVLPAPRMAE